MWGEESNELMVDLVKTEPEHQKSLARLNSAVIVARFGARARDKTMARHFVRNCGPFHRPG